MALFRCGGGSVKPLPIRIVTANFVESGSSYPTANVNLDNLGWTKLTLTEKGTTGSVKTWRYRLDSGSWVTIGSTVGTELSLGSSWSTIQIQLAGVGSISRTVTLS